MKEKVEIEYDKLTKILEIKDYNVKDNSMYNFNERTLIFIKELSQKYDDSIHKNHDLNYESAYIVFSEIYECLINKNWKLAIDIRNFLNTKPLYNDNNDDYFVQTTYSIIIDDIIIIHNIYNNWLIDVDFN